MNYKEIEPHGEIAFYEWLDGVLQIANARKLSVAAGLQENRIEEHVDATYIFRDSKSGYMHGEKKLQNEHFAAVARAVMQATGGTIVIRWDTFQLNVDGVICIHGANEKQTRVILHPLTDEQFNGLF